MTKTREKLRKTGSCDLNNRSAVGEFFLLPNAENPLLWGIVAEFAATPGGARQIDAAKWAGSSCCASDFDSEKGPLACWIALFRDSHAEPT